MPLKMSSGKWEPFCPWGDEWIDENVNWYTTKMIPVGKFSVVTEVETEAIQTSISTQFKLCWYLIHLKYNFNKRALKIKQSKYTPSSRINSMEKKELKTFMGLWTPNLALVTSLIELPWTNFCETWLKVQWFSLKLHFVQTSVY